MGAPISFYSGRNQSALRQDFALQNACTPLPRRARLPRGKRCHTVSFSFRPSMISKDRWDSTAFLLRLPLTL